MWHGIEGHQYGSVEGPCHAMPCDATSIAVAPLLSSCRHRNMVYYQKCVPAVEILIYIQITPIFYSFASASSVCSFSILYSALILVWCTFGVLLFLSLSVSLAPYSSFICLLPDFAFRSLSLERICLCKEMCARRPCQKTMFLLLLDWRDTKRLFLTKKQKFMLGFIFVFFFRSFFFLALFFRVLFGRTLENICSFRIARARICASGGGSVVFYGN